MTAEVRDQGNLRFVNPSELAPPPGYTHVVEASGGRTVYLSGQVALDASGEVMGIGDLRAQTRQVFENLEVALGAVGAGFKDVVKLTYYVADPSWEGGALRSVRDEYVDTERPPASTAVGVRRHFREELLVEVEAVAVLPA
jgi:enamine deaminase RidA (YjgF/YER057c/UK114 family)